MFKTKESKLSEILPEALPHSPPESLRQTGPAQSALRHPGCPLGFAEGATPAALPPGLGPRPELLQVPPAGFKQTISPIDGDNYPLCIIQKCKLIAKGGQKIDT